jgi:hypothetical protein
VSDDRIEVGGGHSIKLTGGGGGGGEFVAVKTLNPVAMVLLRWTGLDKRTMGGTGHARAARRRRKHAGEKKRD